MRVPFVSCVKRSFIGFGGFLSNYHLSFFECTNGDCWTDGDDRTDRDELAETDGQRRTGRGRRTEMDGRTDGLADGRTCGRTFASASSRTQRTFSSGTRRGRHDHSTYMNIDYIICMYNDHSTCIMSYWAHVRRDWRQEGLEGEDSFPGKAGRLEGRNLVRTSFLSKSRTHSYLESLFELPEWWFSKKFPPYSINFS